MTEILAKITEIIEIIKMLGLGIAGLSVAVLAISMVSKSLFKSEMQGYIKSTTISVIAGVVILQCIESIIGTLI